MRTAIAATPGGSSNAPPPNLGNLLPASTIWGSTQPVNPPPAPGLYGRNPNYPILRPGYMQMLTPYVPTGIKYRLNFLFNPSEIQESYSLNQNYTNPGMLPSSVQGQVAYVLSGVSLGWSLFFDRRLDVASGKSDMGVLVDIGAFENMLSARVSVNGVSETSGQLMGGPVKAVFGIGSKGTVFEFTGMVSSATTTFAQFNKDMIPTVATIDVSLTRILYNINNNTTIPPQFTGAGPTAPGPTGATRTALETRAHSAPVGSLTTPPPPPVMPQR